MTVWNVFVGDHGCYLNEFNSQTGKFPPEMGSTGFVAIGWARVGDMTMYAGDKPAYEKNFTHVYKTENTQQRNCLWNFYDEIKKGDWIVSRSAHHGCILVGQATGSYFYDTDVNAFAGQRTQTYLQNIREVEWKAIITKTDPRYAQLSGNGGLLTVSESAITDLDLQKILICSNSTIGTGVVSGNGSQSTLNVQSTFNVN